MGTIYKNAGIEAARAAGEHPAMDVQANRVLGLVKGFAAPHQKTRALQGSLSMSRAKGKRGVTDRVIESSDPAILSIEYGHTTKYGTRVPGLFIFQRAAAAAGAGSPTRFAPKRGDR